MNFSRQRISSVAALPFLALLVVGCASPGPPRPPSLHLPQRLTQLHADRRGETVVIRFNVPTRSSDDQPLTAPVLATLCRGVDDGPCQPTASFPGRLQVSGSVEWKDVLPLELSSGPDRLLTYRVELFTPRGRSAGPSDAVYAAAGRAPLAVGGLKAEGSRQGVLLRWQPERVSGAEVLVLREDLGARPLKPSKADRQVKPFGRKTAVAVPMTPIASTTGAAKVWLHAEGGAGSDPGGMIDNAARSGEPYRYVAVRRRKVLLKNKELELRSEASAPVELRMEDTFPPAVPQGLQAASFAVATDAAPAADLVWTPGVEMDLSGYNVYRQTMLPAGGYSERKKLTAEPVALPAFHDATVQRGVGYRYTVTAIDRKGNESAPSAPADVEPMP